MGFSAIHVDQWKDVLHATKTKIPVNRLAAWIQQQVEGRQLPVQVHGKYPMDGNATLPRPQVVMKWISKAWNIASFPTSRLAFIGSLLLHA